MFIFTVCGFETHNCATTSTTHNNFISCVYVGKDGRATASGPHTNLLCLSYVGIVWLWDTQLCNNARDSQQSTFAMLMLAVCGFQTHSCATTDRIHDNIICSCLCWPRVVLRPAGVQQQARFTRKKCQCLCWPCVVLKHTVVQQQAGLTTTYFAYVYVGRLWSWDTQSCNNKQDSQQFALCMVVLAMCSFETCICGTTNKNDNNLLRLCLCLPLVVLNHTVVQ